MFELFVAILWVGYFATVYYLLFDYIWKNYLRWLGVNMFEYYLVGGIVLAVFYLVYIIYYDDFIDFFKF